MNDRDTRPCFPQFTALLNCRTLTKMCGKLRMQIRCEATRIPIIGLYTSLDSSSHTYIHAFWSAFLSSLYSSSYSSLTSTILIYNNRFFVECIFSQVGSSVAVRFTENEDIFVIYSQQLQQYGEQCPKKTFSILVLVVI